MRILVTGSRDYRDPGQITNAFGDVLRNHGSYADVTLVVGDASGADAIATVFAKSKGLMVEVYCASWGEHGKSAGPKRNQRMVDDGADVCLVFPKIGAENKGTLDCMTRAFKAGIPIRSYPR